MNWRASGVLARRQSTSHAMAGTSSLLVRAVPIMGIIMET